MFEVSPFRLHRRIFRPAGSGVKAERSEFIDRALTPLPAGLRNTPAGEGRLNQDRGSSCRDVAQGCRRSIAQCTEYAYRYMAEYSVVWWVHAEEPATLAAEYASLAGRLGLVEQNDVDQQAAVSAVRFWMERHGNWLVILDDARDPSECNVYIPNATSGHILITSRNPNWRESADPFRVGTLARGEATEFLQKRTRQNDLQAIASLCHALGDLPLALEQAAAYIETTGVSVAEYLTRFQNYAAVSPSESDPHSIATAWKFSFDRLQQEVPEAMELLSLLAFLAPDDIPRDLLVLGGSHLRSGLCAIVSDTQSLHRILTELQRHSLIDVRGDALFVHQSVQSVTRDRLAGQNIEGGVGLGRGSRCRRSIPVSG